MGTAAQAWFEPGEAPGMAEGMSKTLVRLLQRRFGPLPDGIQTHIAAADLGQLDRWLDAVLDAPTLDVVFGGTSEHR